MSGKGTKAMLFLIWGGALGALVREVLNFMVLEVKRIFLAAVQDVKIMSLC